MKFERSLDTYLAIAQYHLDKGTTVEDMIKKARKSGHGVFSEDIKKKFGTIYTPEFVVRKTIDLAWKYLTKDSNTLNLTYCDPACGDSNFLEILYEKLMQEEGIQDPIKKSHYILTKCIYGIEILTQMVQASKIRLAILHLRTVEKNGEDPGKEIFQKG